MAKFAMAFSQMQVLDASWGALENYAETLLLGYSPELLTIPNQLDIDSFLEYYLGLTVDFMGICHEHKVLGLTVLDDVVIRAAAPNGWEIINVPVKGGTVILDTSLTADYLEPRLRFTMAHEAAHWLLHRSLFLRQSRFGAANVHNCRNPALTNRMETQADFLAAAILMPLPALRTAVADYFGYYSEKPRRIIRKANPMDDCMAIQLPQYIAKTFNVSKQSALIRLEKLGIITGR